MKYISPLISLLLICTLFSCKDDPISLDPIVQQPDPICGCTDTSAYNYEHLVSCLDSSCIFASDKIVGIYMGKRMSVFVQNQLPSLGPWMADTLTIVKLSNSQAQISGYQNAVLTILPVKFEDYVKYTFLTNGTIYSGGFMKDDSLHFDTPAEFNSWGTTWYHFKGRRIQ